MYSLLPWQSLSSMPPKLCSTLPVSGLMPVITGEVAVLANEIPSKSIKHKICHWLQSMMYQWNSMNVTSCLPKSFGGTLMRCPKVDSPSTVHTAMPRHQHSVCIWSSVDLIPWYISTLLTHAYHQVSSILLWNFWNYWQGKPNPQWIGDFSILGHINV